MLCFEKSSGAICTRSEILVFIRRVSNGVGCRIEGQWLTRMNIVTDSCFRLRPRGEADSQLYTIYNRECLCPPAVRTVCSILSTSLVVVQKLVCAQPIRSWIRQAFKIERLHSAIQLPDPSLTACCVCMALHQDLGPTMQALLAPNSETVLKVQARGLTCPSSCRFHLVAALNL